MGTPIAGWFVMQHPIKMDELGVPPNFFGKSPQWSSHDILQVGVPQKTGRQRRVEVVLQ